MSNARWSLPSFPSPASRSKRHRRLPRRRSRGSNVAEEAFGPSPTPATPGVAPAAAYPGLEEVLEEVIDADAPVPQADLSGDDVEDKWIQCSRCGECRMVPHGLFFFQNKEASFCCRVVGAACCLIQKRKRVLFLALEVG